MELVGERELWGKIPVDRISGGSRYTGVVLSKETDEREGLEYTGVDPNCFEREVSRSWKPEDIGESVSEIKVDVNSEGSSKEKVSIDNN